MVENVLRRCSVAVIVDLGLAILGHSEVLARALCTCGLPTRSKRPPVYTGNLHPLTCEL